MKNSAAATPKTAPMPVSTVRHCLMKSSMLMTVPRWTMTNPTTTPANASSEELVSRSDGNNPDRKPTRKMIEATNRDETSPLDFADKKSLTVQMAMMTVNASTGFIESSQVSCDGECLRGFTARLA